VVVAGLKITDVAKVLEPFGMVNEVICSVPLTGALIADILDDGTLVLRLGEGLDLGGVGFGVRLGKFLGAMLIS